MKNLLISVFALGLAAAAPTALLAAQDDHHGPGGGGAPHGSMGGGHAASSHDSGGMGGGHHTTTRSSYHHTTRSTHHTSHYSSSHHTTTIHRTTVNNRTTHVKVDVSSYRKAFNAPNHYHLGDYRAPPGYAYRRWNYGEVLPREYWAQDYWLNNYLNFGLVAPPDGYVWVRYGPDAVLIDEDTGEIVQVEYGLFY